MIINQSIKISWVSINQVHSTRPKLWYEIGECELCLHFRNNNITTENMISLLQICSCHRIQKIETKTNKTSFWSLAENMDFSRSWSLRARSSCSMSITCGRENTLENNDEKNKMGTKQERRASHGVKHLII